MMRNLLPLTAATAAAATLSLGLMSGTAAAGPCQERMSDISRAMSNTPDLGGTGTSGALAGTAPGAIQNKAPMPASTPEGAAEATGEGVKGKAVGTTMAGNAPGSLAQPVDPAGGRATSPQDVRLQSKGEPTVAQGGNPNTPDNLSQAKMALESARALDAKGDAGCNGALDQAEQLMKKGA